MIRLIEVSYSSDSLAPIDLHHHLTKKSGMIEVSQDTIVVKTDEMVKNEVSSVLNFASMLPFAAPHYKISPNYKDYVLVPVIVMPSDIPNRNACAFPLAELIRFNPERGQQAYKTWIGKPVHYEHDNKDITKAHGIIVDAMMRKLQGYGNGRVWKVLLLLAIDRTKYSNIASKVLRGDINSYSMGAWVERYECSYCGLEVGKDCPHINPQDPANMYEINGKLAFRNAINIEGFETSIVGSPAFMSAISDHLLPFDMKQNHPGLETYS